MDNETSTQQLERNEKPLNEYGTTADLVPELTDGRLLTSTMVSIYVGPENTHWLLHERLLCYYSPFFADIFYADDKNPDMQKARRNKAYGMPDEEDLPFEMLVGWLYSRDIKVPKEEKDVGPLLDLYLLSEKLRMERLSTELVEAISDFYYNTKTYPALRRVQHIYANTDEDNQMREMMVGAVAKLLTTSEKIPSHWAAALQRNGQLAVDIIRSIQQWKIEENSIPDARDRSSSRGRSAKNGFSAVDRQGTDSMETDLTGTTSNLGVESLNSDNERDQSMKSAQILKSEESEARSPPPNYSMVSTPDSITSSAFTTPQTDTSQFSQSPPRPSKPPDQKSSLSPDPSKITHSTPKRRLSVTFAKEVSYKKYTFFPSPLATDPDPDRFEPELDISTSINESHGGLAIKPLVSSSNPPPPSPPSLPLPVQQTRSQSDDQVVRTPVTAVTTAAAVEPLPSTMHLINKERALAVATKKPEVVMLSFLWMLYLSWLASTGST